MQRRDERRHTVLAVMSWLSSLPFGWVICYIKACLSSPVIYRDMDLNMTTDNVWGQRNKSTYFLCQVPVLFNGCRSGEIFSIDLRQRGRRDQSWKASRFHQESAITSVRVLQDENYLLAADMLGQVRLLPWKQDNCYKLWVLDLSQGFYTLQPQHNYPNPNSKSSTGSKSNPGIIQNIIYATWVLLLLHWLCVFSLFVCRSSCGMCVWQSQCRTTKATTMSMPTFPSTSMSLRGFCWQVWDDKTC